MKTTTKLGVVLGLVLVLGVGLTAQATTWGPDLLNGAGDFDTQTDRDAWELSITNSRLVSEFTANPVRSPDMAWAGRSTATGTTTHYTRVVYNNVPLVGGRNIQVFMYARKATANGNFRTKLSNTNESELGFTLNSFNAWENITQTYSVMGNGNMTGTFTIQNGVANTNSTTKLYTDDIVLQREVVDPVVDSKSADNFQPNTPVTFSITAPGGTNGNGDKRFFDPDALVTCLGGGVTNISTTWASDTQLNLQLTTGGPGPATLQVQNPYGGMAETFSFTVVPEPATIGLLVLGGLLLRRKR